MSLRQDGQCVKRCSQACLLIRDHPDQRSFAGFTTLLLDAAIQPATTLLRIQFILAAASAVELLMLVAAVVPLGSPRAPSAVLVLFSY